MTDATRTRGGVGEALKPCPLCANPKVQPRCAGADMWSILCFDCGAESAWAEGMDAAMDAWNKRPGEDAALARAEKAEAERDLLAAKLGIAQGVARAAAKGDGDSRAALIAALARVRELEEGLREIITCDQHYAPTGPRSPFTMQDGPWARRAAALLALKQEGG